MRASWLAFASLLSASACGGMGADSGGFGATPGGVKDIANARELVANGRVPPAAALLVEGMFAEHDLGLDGEPCARTLCLRAAAGIAPDGEGRPAGWVQVGLSSTIDPATWRRPATTFILTVDVSGSMGWEYGGGEYPSPGNLARAYLLALVPLLGPEDRVALVTYGSDVSVPLGLSPGSDKERLRAKIMGLSTNGSTNMEAGLRTAFELGGSATRDHQTAQTRVILFTDEQPNVGATTATEFQRIVADGASQGVSLTVMALGLGIGPEVLRGMAHLRGANAFTLSKMTDVEHFMADEYPWFTTPIATDLRLAVAPVAGYELAESFGFPEGNAGAAAVSIDTETVFLSKKKGALLVSFAPSTSATAGALRAELVLSYRTMNGELVTQPLRASTEGLTVDERGQAFAQPATARATALALLVTGMHDAAQIYGTMPDKAVGTMQKTLERFQADVTALKAPDLDGEISFATRLLELMRKHAPQGSFYGEY